MSLSFQYHVQDLIANKIAFPFHESIKATWEIKWKFLAHAGLYPFSDGKGEDFDSIFENLIEENDNNPMVFFDPDRYAKPFFKVGLDLVERAKTAEKAGNTDEARDLFLRAGAVYRLARFPINRSPLSQRAWELGKEAYLSGAKYLSSPVHEVAIPHKHASVAERESADSTIGAFLRIPEGKMPEDGWPLVLFISGLDAYRTDHSSSPSGKLYSHLNYGQAVLIVDIPGTADSPAARNDPASPDRLWSSVFDWIDEHKVEYGINVSRLAARGISTGGYYAMRIAHTHAERLVAVVSQGGGSHYMFDPAWIRAQNHMEYPFALADALAYKFGYKDVESYISDNPQARFSLVDSGIFDQKCTRLLLINGYDDSIFPIEDSIEATRHGRIKDARFINGRGHMGAPESEAILRDWLLEIL
jgi:pimeloyl-ACP methyl ester carboxylesterase